MKEKIKYLLKKVLIVAAILVVTAIIVDWTSDRIVSWHYEEFIAPFLAGSR